MNIRKLENAEQYYYHQLSTDITRKDSIIKFSNEIAPSMHDHNFIYINNDITINEFIEMHQIERKESLSNDTTFIKYFFRVGYTLKDNLLSYLKDSHFDLEHLHFYYLNPKHLQSHLKTFQHTSEIKLINNSDLLEEYLSFNFRKDSIVCPIFAKERRELNKVLFASPSIRLYLAFYKGKPAGTAELFVRDNVGKIENVYVTKSLRGKRIGTQLIEQIIELNKSTVQEIYLASTTDNTNTKNLYTKIGFTPIGSQYTAYLNL